MKNEKRIAFALLSGFSILAVTACKNAPEQAFDAKTAPVVAAQGSVKQQSAESKLTGEKGIDARIKKEENKLNEDKNNIQLIATLADLYMKNNQTSNFGRAEALIEKGLYVSPGDPALLRLKGEILFRLKKKGAVEAYQKAIDNCGNKSELRIIKSFSYFGLARYYQRENNKLEALENAEKAYALDRSNKYIEELLRQLDK